jgi:hypothetical protein
MVSKLRQQAASATVGFSVKRTGRQAGMALERPVVGRERLIRLRLYSKELPSVPKERTDEGGGTCGLRNLDFGMRILDLARERRYRDPGSAASAVDTESLTIPQHSLFGNVSQ